MPKSSTPPPKTQSHKSTANYKRLFDLYDINNDGYLDMREFTAALKNIKSGLQLKEAYKSFDMDFDKRIDMQEFMRMMKILTG